jgi:hypothetical protein
MELEAMSQDKIVSFVACALSSKENDYIRNMISNYIELWHPTEEQKAILRAIRDKLYQQKYNGFTTEALENICYRCKRGEHKDKCASDFCTCCGDALKNGQAQQNIMK